jgi:hypothetical protein
MARGKQTPPHWRNPPPIQNPADRPRPGFRGRYSRALIEETIRVWQPFYPALLTEGDACEIIENMTMFAATLMGLGGIVRPLVETSSEPD